MNIVHTSGLFTRYENGRVTGTAQYRPNACGWLVRVGNPIREFWEVNEHSARIALAAGKPAIETI